MNEHDEAMDRLRAADPAIGSHPDLHELRNRLEVHTPLGADGDVAQRFHDPAVHGSRWPLAVAASVAALALGIGGYTLGAQHERLDELQAGKPSTAQEDNASKSASEQDSSSARSGAETASSYSVLERGDSAGMPGAGYGYGYGPVRLVPGSGLTDDSGSYEVTRSVAPDIDLKRLVQGWATAQGLEGETEPTEDGVSLHSGDHDLGASGLPTYVVLDYNNNSVTPYCDQGMEDGWMGPDGPSSYSGMAVTSAPADEAFATSSPTAPPVSEADCPEQPAAPTAKEAKEAKAMVSDVLKGTGVDLTDYEFDVNISGPALEIYGRQTGAPSGFMGVVATVTADGVANVHVDLREEVSLGQYSIISAREAVARYGHTEFAVNEGFYYVDEPANLERPEEFPAEPPKVAPVDVQPGDPIPFPIEDVTITEAHLVQGQLGLPGTEGITIPVYRLRSDEGATYYVNALADEALDFTP